MMTGAAIGPIVRLKYPSMISMFGILVVQIGVLPVATSKSLNSNVASVVLIGSPAAVLICPCRLSVVGIAATALTLKRVNSAITRRMFFFIKNFL